MALFNAFFVFAVFIILNAGHIVGQVLLSYIVVREIMGIAVARAAFCASRIGSEVAAKGSLQA